MSDSVTDSITHNSATLQAACVQTSNASMLWVDVYARGASSQRLFNKLRLKEKKRRTKKKKEREKQKGTKSR